jgi:hypothetical protein
MTWHAHTANEEEGICRGEVTAIMLGIFDMKVGTAEVLRYLREEEDDDETEEEEPIYDRGRVPQVDGPVR